MIKKKMALLLLSLAITISNIPVLPGDIKQVQAMEVGKGINATENSKSIDTAGALEVINRRYDNGIKLQNTATTLTALDFLALCNEKELVKVTVEGKEREEIEKVVEEQTKGLTSDYDKGRALTQWVTSNIRYISDQSVTISSDPYDVFKDKAGVCGGFSNLLNEMLCIAGIPAVAIIGTYHGNLAVGQAHQWNVAYVNGGWVYCDGTGSLFAEGMAQTHVGTQILDAYIPYDDLLIGYYKGLAVTGTTSKKVTVPDAYQGYPITSLSNTLFSEAYGVEELYINAHITVIDESTLRSLSTMKKIEVSEDNTVYTSYQGALFNADKSELLIYPKSSENKEFIWPKSLVKFDDKDGIDSQALEKITVEGENEKYTSHQGVLYDAKKENVLFVPQGMRRIEVYENANITRNAFPYLYNNSDMSVYTIVGMKDSPAEKFASENNIKFLVYGEVEKLEPGKDDFHLVLPENLTYDGKTQFTATVKTKSGITGMGEIKAVKYNGQEAAPVKAGTYTISIEVLEGEGYNSISELVLGSMTVLKKEVKLPIIPSKEYTGQTLKADVPESTEYKVAENKGGIEPGSYDVKLELKDFDNYKWEGSEEKTYTLIFTITKKETPVERKTPKDTDFEYVLPEKNIYDGITSFEVNVTVKSQIEGMGKINKVKYNGQEGAPVKAGTYEITIDVEEGDSYNSITNLVIGTMTIEKKGIKPPNISAKKYTGELLTADIPESSEYKVIENKGGVEPGSYNVILELSDAENYKWDGSEGKQFTLTFTITESDKPTDSDKPTEPDEPEDDGGSESGSDNDDGGSESGSDNDDGGSESGSDNDGGGSESGSDNDGGGSESGSDNDSGGNTTPGEGDDSTIVREGIWVTGLEEDYIYTGNMTRPDIRVYDGDKLLIEKKDYTLVHKNNRNASDRPAGDSAAPYVEVRMKGSYTGKTRLYYKISPVDISEAMVVEDKLTAIVKPGKTANVAPVLYWQGKKLKEGRDFVITGQTKKLPVGETFITIEGKNNFKGIITTEILVSEGKDPSLGYEIIPMNSFKIKAEQKTVSYVEGKKALLTGYTLIGKSTIPKKEEYEEIYYHNEAAGTGYLVLKGTGLDGNGDNKVFCGTVTLPFKIQGTVINGKNISFEGFEGHVYGLGKEIRPTDIKEDVTAVAYLSHNGKKLEEGKHYTVVYTNNIDKGNATATFTGISAGGYTGTYKKTFKIEPLPITDLEYEVSGNNIRKGKEENTYIVPYTKGTTTPSVVISKDGKELAYGKDYTISYKNNKNIGQTARATVKGKGNYSGSFSFDFLIEAKELSNSNGIRVEVKDKTDNGKNNNWKQTVKVYDSNGKILSKKDYDVESFKVISSSSPEIVGKELEASDRLQAGDVIQVTIKGKGDYISADGIVATGTYRILTKGYDISKATIKLKPKEYTGDKIEILGQDDFDKAVLNPGNKQLELGKNMEVVEGSYVKNIEKETARVILKGIGDFGGTKTVTFKITGLNTENKIEIVRDDFDK